MGIMKPRRLAIRKPLEADEQRAVVSWLRRRGHMVFAVPNGGKRHVAEAKNLKEQGVLAGIPDLVVVTVPPVAIEMKREDGDGPTIDQRERHTEMTARGWRVIVGYGFKHARAQLEEIGL